jgi:RNA polymerase sigma factor for flagellar operon FliA
MTDAMERLPERQRKVLVLYYYEELYMKEIGEVLGLSESRISQLHSRALYRLSREME